MEEYVQTRQPLVHYQKMQMIQTIAEQIMSSVADVAL